MRVLMEDAATGKAVCIEASPNDKCGKVEALWRQTTGLGPATPIRMMYLGSLMDEDLELECYDLDQDDETINVFFKCRSMETLGAQAMATHRAGGYRTFTRRKEVPAEVTEFLSAEREDFLPQEEEPELQNTSEAALAVAGGERKKGGRRFSAISRWLIPRDSVHEVGGGGGEAGGMQAQNGAANGASAHGNPLAEKLNSFSTAQLKAAAALDLDEYSATVVSDESLAEHTTLPPAVFVTKSWRLQNTGARDWAGVMLVALAPPAILPEDARESGQSATTPVTPSKASAPPQPSPKTPGKFRLGGGGRGAAAAATPPPPPQPVVKAAEGSRIDPVAPGETGRVSVPLKSPDVAGRYLVWFQLHTADGKPFGARFFSELTVVGRDADSGEQDRAKANWVASMDVAQLRAALLAAPVALPPPPVQPQPSTPVSPSTRLSSTSAEVLSAVASGGLVDGMDTDEEGQSDGSDE